MSCDAAEPVVFEYVEGDNLPELLVQYLDANGEGIDITGWTIVLKIAYAIPVIVTATLPDPTHGYFSFIYGDTDLVAGIWDVNITITNLASKKLTIRNIKFDIAPRITP
jgi:hypothetical protein